MKRLMNTPYRNAALAIILGALLTLPAAYLFRKNARSL
jgi:hypothetical protein